MRDDVLKRLPVVSRHLVIAHGLEDELGTHDAQEPAARAALPERHALPLPQLLHLR